MPTRKGARVKSYKSKVKAKRQTRAYGYKAKRKPQAK